VHTARAVQNFRKNAPERRRPSWEIFRRLDQSERERDYLMPAGGTMKALNELASSCAQRIYTRPCAYIRGLHAHQHHPLFHIYINALSRSECALIL